MYTTSHTVATGPVNGTDSGAGVDGSGTINPAALNAHTGTPRYTCCILSRGSHRIYCSYLLAPRPPNLVASTTDFEPPRREAQSLPRISTRIRDHGRS